MRTAGLLVLFFASACGGGTQEPKAPAAEPEPPKHVDRPTLSVQQELGSIDPADVQKTWNRLQGDFSTCRKRGAERIEYLHGDAKFFVRVGPDGTAKWSYLEDSNIGDHETEKCLLDAIAQAKWPKPYGGDAEVRNSIGFDPDGRAPASWPTDKIASVLGKNDKDLQKCKAGAKGTVHVTLYVQPNHKEGKVAAVGAATPSKDGSTSIECIVNEVKSWKMPSPGSWAAKVEFRI